jgi:signal transduction histidine kinase/CheY-like chemotaxis protein/HPt (histidine-containing phosphotransfer) domain-containing protein
MEKINRAGSGKTEHELDRQRQLLYTVNTAATVLLSGADDDNFEASLLKSLELVARCVEVDRINIWRNETRNGVLHYVMQYGWLSDIGRQGNHVRQGDAFPYDDSRAASRRGKVFRGWKIDGFLDGKCINSTLSTLPPYMRDEVKQYSIKSILILPVFRRESFWGLVSLDDCHNERTFAEDEISILRSASLMIVSAVNRNAHATQINEAHERANLMMKEVERKNQLLDTVNRAADILLKAEVDDFKGALWRCMGMMAEAADVDRVYIWKNLTIEGRLHCSQIYEWSESAEPQQGNELTIDIMYSESIPPWEKTLSGGNCVNGLVRDLSPEEQAQLSPQGILSILVVPIHLHNRFWGFMGFDDCSKERVFTENEEAILRSASLLVTHALLRNNYITDIVRLQSELEAALKKAQSANRAKSGFLARMSHEMRTPLNAIIGLSELALINGGLSMEALSSTEKIYNAGITLLDTVNDLLDISKIEAGKLELVQGKYDIPSLINDAVTQSLSHIGEKPVKFVLDITNDLPLYLYGDNLKVKQIFNNILSNAFKYTKEGTVELSLRCEREGDSVWMTIRVRDTGIGIRAEELSRLFSDYTQMNMESNRDVRGTGLGLAITKRIAEMMEGSIAVESEYGKGSVFTARIRQKFVTDATIGAETLKNLKDFRYSYKAAFKSGAGSKLTPIKLPDARVLVVDDIPVNLDVAKGMLKPYGMQIDCVTSGQAAIDAIRDEKVRYDAIFMDHMMPGMDGIKAARAIREKIGTEYARTIPVIALTANAIPSNRKKFLRNGFQDFLSKPIEMAKLDAVIRKWLWDGKTGESSDSGQIHTGKQALPDNCGRKDINDHSGRKNGIECQQAPGEKTARLDVEKGVERFGGDRESYKLILNSFAESTRSLLPAVRGVTGDNLANYAITVHGIKGSSRSVCADVTGNMAEALEKAAKAGDFGFVHTHNQDFIKTVEELLEHIDDVIKEMTPENSKALKDKPDIETLSELLAACKKYDMDAVDAAMSDIENFKYESDDGLAAWLRTNVEQMNFAQIEEKLSALIAMEDGERHGEI